MAFEPGEDLARVIVRVFFTTGLSRKNAVMEALDRGDISVPGYNPESMWEEAWFSKNVQKELGKWETEAGVQESLRNKAGILVDEYLSLAQDEGTKDTVRERALRWLQETAGISPKRELEVTHRSEFESMGVEALMEYIEAEMPLYCEHCGEHVSLDREQFVKGSF